MKAAAKKAPHEAYHRLRRAPAIAGVAGSPRLESDHPSHRPQRQVVHVLASAPEYRRNGPRGPIDAAAEAQPQVVRGSVALGAAVSSTWRPATRRTHPGGHAHPTRYLALARVPGRRDGGQHLRRPRSPGTRPGESRASVGAGSCGGGPGHREPVHRKPVRRNADGVEVVLDASADPRARRAVACDGAIATSRGIRALPWQARARVVNLTQDQGNEE